MLIQTTLKLLSVHCKQALTRIMQWLIIDQEILSLLEYLPSNQ